MIGWNWAYDKDATEPHEILGSSHSSAGGRNIAFSDMEKATSCLTQTKSAGNDPYIGSSMQGIWEKTPWPCQPCIPCRDRTFRADGKMRWETCIWRILQAVVAAEGMGHIGAKFLRVPLPSSNWNWHVGVGASPLTKANAFSTSIHAPSEMPLA